MHMRVGAAVYGLVLVQPSDAIYKLYRDVHDDTIQFNR